VVHRAGQEHRASQRRKLVSRLSTMQCNILYCRVLGIRSARTAWSASFGMWYVRYLGSSSRPGQPQAAGPRCAKKGSSDSSSPSPSCCCCSAVVLRRGARFVMHCITLSADSV
jgi:hypothetical protein